MKLRKTRFSLVFIAVLAAQFATALTTINVYAAGAPPLAGFDGTSGAAAPLSASALNALNSSDDAAYATMNGWPTHAYDNASRLEFVVPSVIPFNDSQVAVKHFYSKWEHRKKGGWITAAPGNCSPALVGEAKIVVFDGSSESSVTAVNLWPAENDVDASYVVDLAGVLDSPSKVNSARISFTAWGRQDYAFVPGWCFTQHFDTRHDLVGFEIVYGMRPTQPGVSVTPASPYTVDDLVCAVTTPSTDPDGNSANIAYEFQWLEDGVPIAGQASSVLPASETEKNKVYACVVTPRDEEGIPGVPGTASVSVLNTPPTAAAVSILPSPAYSADDLYCNATAFDADGDVLSYSFKWSEDGVELPGQNAGVLPASLTVKHRSYACNATPHDGEAAGPSGVGSTTVLNTPPTIAILSPAGGEKWSGSHNITWTAVDADGDNFSLQVFYSVDNSSWTLLASTENDGVELFDSTAVASGIGRVRVSGYDGEGTSFVDSNAFAVDNLPPVTTAVLPPTAFPSNAVKWYNYSSVAVSLSAADWPAGFNYSFCSIQNNGSTVDCSSSSNPNNFSVAGEGQHRIAFYSVDSADASNVEAVREVIIGIDLVAPTAPQNLSAPTSVTAPAIQLTWQPANDAGSGVCGYNVYANGSLAAQVSGADNNTFSFTATADGTYEFNVTAVDCAGSEGPASNTVFTSVDLPEQLAPTPVPAYSPPSSSGGVGYPIPQQLRTPSPTSTPTPAPSAAPDATPSPQQLNFSPSKATPAPTAPAARHSTPTPTATPAPKSEEVVYASAATGLFSLSDSFTWLALFALVVAAAVWRYREYRKGERNLLNA